MEIYPEIFHVLLPAVELRGKWCGRRPNCFISVSKKDLSDVFVFSGDGGEMWLLWAFQGKKKSDGAIFTYTRRVGKSFEAFLPDNSRPLEILMPFKQIVF